MEENTGIEVNHVYKSFGKEQVLMDVNFSIPPGSIYGVVGNNGSGKTVLMKCICGFMKCDRGKIVVNGINVKEYNLASLRKNIAIVSQNTFLLDDTIENNLTLNNKKIEPSHYISNLIKKMGIDEFISKLPDGYLTEVGENGVKLSGGQRQRIAIVRMLLQAKDILIFDEATSALDNITQDHILDKLKQYYNNKIVIMIAHRISVIKKADEILVFNDGKIVESGNHETLMKMHNYYYHLVEERSA